jgi:hypothetical protein
VGGDLRGVREGAEIAGELGIWESATPIQRAEMVRMKEQVGVYEMALRLALHDLGDGDIEEQTASYIGKAAVLVEAAVPD